MRPAAALTRFVKFGVVGGSGVGVNAGALYLLTEKLGLDYRVSSLLAIELAIINNFIWNSLWTWRDRRHHDTAMLARRFAKFNVSAAATAVVVNWGLLVLLTEVWGMYYQVSNLIGIGCGTIVNFLVSHFWVFTHAREVPSDTPAAPPAVSGHGSAPGADCSQGINGG